MLLTRRVPPKASICLHGVAGGEYGAPRRPRPGGSTAPRGWGARRGRSVGDGAGAACLSLSALASPRSPRSGRCEPDGRAARAEAGARTRATSRTCASSSGCRRVRVGAPPVRPGASVSARQPRARGRGGDFSPWGAGAAPLAGEAAAADAATAPAPPPRRTARRRSRAPRRAESATRSSPTASTDSSSPRRPRRRRRRRRRRPRPRPRPPRRRRRRRPRRRSPPRARGGGGRRRSYPRSRARRRCGTARPSNLGDSFLGRCPRLWAGLPGRLPGASRAGARAP